MQGFAKAMRTKRIQEKRDKNPYTKPPKGFDISLAAVISEFDLDTESIQKIGEMTANREIANATVGNNVFYRRATIERLFGAN